MLAQVRVAPRCLGIRQFTSEPQVAADARNSRSWQAATQQCQGARSGQICRTAALGTPRQGRSQEHVVPWIHAWPALSPVLRGRVKVGLRGRTGPQATQIGPIG